MLGTSYINVITFTLLCDHSKRVNGIYPAVLVKSNHYFIILVFRYRVSLCSPGSPGDQANLELIEIRLPLPPQC